MPTSGTYETIRRAIQAKQQIHANYRGHRRLMCPHVIGYSADGREQVLAYQFGGSSDTNPVGWKCMPVAGLSQVSVHTGKWHTGDRHTQRQTCVYDVDVVVDY